MKPNFDHCASLRCNSDWRHCYVTTQFAAGMSTLGWLLVDDETPTQIEIPLLLYREKTAARGKSEVFGRALKSPVILRGNSTLGKLISRAASSDRYSTFVLRLGLT